MAKLWDWYENIKRKTADFVIEAWQGFSRVLDPEIIPTLYHSENTRKILTSSFVQNIVVYMGLTMFINASIKMAMSFDEENPYLQSLGQSLDFMLKVGIILPIAVERFVDNTFYNLAITKAADKENPSYDIYANYHKNNIADKLKASLMSNLNLPGKFLTAKVLSDSIPGGFSLSVLVKMLIWGQILVDTKLGEAGAKNSERQIKLNQNNAYIFGLGCALFATHELCRQSIYRLTGAKSFFIDDAIFSFLYQYFIVLTMAIEKPLPGKQEGIDIFYPSRLMLRPFYKKMGDQIETIVRQKNDNQEWINFTKDLSNNKAMQLAGKFYFRNTSLKDFPTALTTPAFTFFFDLYLDTIQDVMHSINIVHTVPGAKLGLKIVATFPDVLINKNRKMLYSTIIDENMGKVLLVADKFINYVKSCQKIKATHEPPPVIKSIGWKTDANLTELRNESYIEPPDLLEEFEMVEIKKSNSSPRLMPIANESTSNLVANTVFSKPKVMIEPMDQYEPELTLNKKMV